MVLRIYNSLSRRKDLFFSTSPDHVVKFFICGPTVYDYAHLGHARTYIAFDIIARYLKFSGYNVNLLMNITDVADRIADRAKQLKKEPLELAREYEKAFLEDMQALGIENVNQYSRASDYIPQITDQIKALLSKDIAYETNTGVYFEVRKFPKFGKLSGLSLEELSLRRLELCSSKKNPEDFSLWRKLDGGFGWASPWGFGRPGWHVEDTAISMDQFGETYDLHGGASELMFPHHDAEIAQAEALSGKSPFVRYWLHTGLLSIGGRKMSKSLGNVIRIRDALKEYTAQELRYYFASFHYREPVRIFDSQLRLANRELQAVSQDFRSFIDLQPETDKRNSEVTKLLTKAEKDFKRHMDNDFDTPNALIMLKTLAKHLKSLAATRAKVDAESKSKMEQAFTRMAYVFGIMPN